ncbi:MAG: hypothetical protein ACREAY_01415 [Nitrososphaera sp.]|uniref:hypothetical protein n=1 Tax=Nitrososphaera sp. TaxID=1971748 RepID=UPI003D6E91AD
MGEDKVRDLVQQAADAMQADAWRAYVAIEYAVLEVKMRHGLEHEPSPPPVKRTAKKADLLALAGEKLVHLDYSDAKKLLYELRICRDALKAATAKP